MLTRNLKTLALTSLVVATLGVACSDDTTDDDGNQAGSAGKAGSSAGSGGKAGSAGSGKGGSAGSSGAGTAGKASAGTGNDALGGEGGEGPHAGGAGGLPSEGGQAGADDSSPGGAGGAGGESGSGGDTTASCETVRAGLLGPIASVSTGLVEVLSAPTATLVSVRIDASAGGYAAAANNPYIYVSLAGKAAVAVTDLEADTSLGWDLAFKRDNIRSNGGDSGAGSARIAELAAADFAAVTAADAATADFGADDFIDDLTCATLTDAINKPLTRFDGWYEYAAGSSTLTPVNKVYLVRGANGTSLYKLQLTGYYQDLSDGMGGTVKKSAVYSLQYEAL
jgi:hypothetical protein